MVGRPGVSLARVSLARSLRPITITERRELGSAATEAIEPAFKMAFGVSIIAQMRVSSGAPASRSVRAAAMIAPGRRPWAREWRPVSAAEAATRSSSPHGVCGPLTRMTTSRPPKPPARTASSDLFAGGDFLVGRDRILEIEDQRVGGQRLGLRQGLGVGAGHVEDASTRAGKHEHLPRLAPRI